jgi:hypothetical protein
MAEICKINMDQSRITQVRKWMSRKLSFQDLQAKDPTLGQALIESMTHNNYIESPYFNYTLNPFKPVHVTLNSTGL